MDEFTRTYSVIHLDAIHKNIQSVKKRVGENTKIMAIVKADAYGHGAIVVANEIKQEVYGFAVATVKEAVELRESGVENAILILGYVSKAEYQTVIQHNITFALLSKQEALDISECAVKMNQAVKCHIKINTGMNRVGFATDENAIAEIQEIYKLQGLNCEGIFMHFATADEKDKTFAKYQFKLFMDIIEQLQEKNIVFSIKHCANSAAIVDMPEMKLDMVREGIILYGLKPSQEVRPNIEYYPAMEIKSHVVFIKEIPKGEGISYGRTYITTRKTKVATIAIGYGDGYARSLSSKGYILIHGKKAPIIGRICMDLMMVDITDIENVQVEDVVTVVGKDGELEISFEELEMLSGKFNYEFVCGISPRVKRKYV